MAKKQEHARLLKAVRELLTLDGWSVVPIRAGPFSEPGIWDLYADKKVASGHRGIWLEIKVGKDQLSDAQKSFWDIRMANGMQCHVIRELSDLKRFAILSNRVKIGA